MTTVRIHVKGKFSDCYIYDGYIFFVEINGRISYMPYSMLIEHFRAQYPQLTPYLSLFLENNNLTTRYKNNIQSLQLISDLITASDKRELSINIDDLEKDLKSFDAGDIMPLLDMKIVNRRIYLCCVHGLYELPLLLDRYVKYISNTNKRIFDGKVVNVSAKYGYIAISLGKDGLLYGLWENDKKGVSINESKIVSDYSLRTIWAGYDIVNYDSARTFQFFKNDVGYSSKSHMEEYHCIKNKHIIEFAAQEIDQTDMFKWSKINPEEVIFCFNSEKTIYFLMRDGRFFRQNLIRDYQDNIRLSSRQIEIREFEKEVCASKLISSVMVPNGFAIELYDRVLLFRNNKTITIENEPIMSMRLFRPSTRCHSVLAISKESGITLHSMCTLDINTADRYKDSGSMQYI